MIGRGRGHGVPAGLDRFFQHRLLPGPLEQQPQLKPEVRQHRGTVGMISRGRGDRLPRDLDRFAENRLLPGPLEQRQQRQPEI
jgi:hypothetical protein